MCGATRVRSWVVWPQVRVVTAILGRVFDLPRLSLQTGTQFALRIYQHDRPIRPEAGLPTAQAGRRSHAEWILNAYEPPAPLLLATSQASDSLKVDCPVLARPLNYSAQHGHHPGLLKTGGRTLYWGFRFGAVAQLGERLVCNQEVAGSIPVGSTKRKVSEAVTDCATGDVTLSGTSGGTTGIVTDSGATYNVAVRGMIIGIASCWPVFCLLLARGCLPVSRRHRRTFLCRRMVICRLALT